MVTHFSEELQIRLLAPEYKGGALQGTDSPVHFQLVGEMRPPLAPLASLSAAVLALLLVFLTPASEAVLPALALPALSTGAASAVIGLSTLALVKEALLFAELSSGRYRRYGSRNRNRNGGRYRHRREVHDDDVDYSGGNSVVGAYLNRSGFEAKFIKLIIPVNIFT